VPCQNYILVKSPICNGYYIGALHRYCLSIVCDKRFLIANIRFSNGQFGRNIDIA